MIACSSTRIIPSTHSDTDTHADITIIIFTIHYRTGVVTATVMTYDKIRYDARCYFNVRSKADMSRLNLPHGNDN